MTGGGDEPEPEPELNLFERWKQSVEVDGATEIIGYNQSVTADGGATTVTLWMLQTRPTSNSRTLIVYDERLNKYVPRNGTISDYPSNWERPTSYAEKLTPSGNDTNVQFVTIEELEANGGIDEMLKLRTNSGAPDGLGQLINIGTV